MGARRRKRTSLSTRYERALVAEGFRRPAGADEAGRGCLAGPVVAAAVMLDAGRPIRGLNDSKLLRPEERESLSEIIHERALAVSVCVIESEEVDRLNVYRASQHAMREAILTLDEESDIALIDGARVPDLPFHQRGIVGGDRVCASIAAASIVAKVHRDDLMRRRHESWPVYNFASNKGYATPEHREALALHGPCPMHRRSFRGVQDPELPFSP